MPKEAPFDVWDGEELGLTDVVEADAPEEIAMHVDPESEPDGQHSPQWSELTDAEDEVDTPVTYFADEQPERSGNGHGPPPAEERELGLEELLERQHYSFPM
jgi:hypothetical protein